jgi:hypothetical protein
MIRKNNQGQVIRVFTYSSPMRKHGGDRYIPQDATLGILDAIPRRAEPCNARGVIVRKAR